MDPLSQNSSIPGKENYVARQMSPNGPISNSPHNARIAIHEQMVHPVIMRKHVDLAAASAPLGLCAFAVTTAVSSTINCGLGTSTSAFLSGIGFFFGGLVQLIVGILHIQEGDGLGGALFGSFGGFWLAHAFVMWPYMMIPQAYADPDEYEVISGVLDLSMGFLTFLMTIASMRKGILFFILVLLVAVTYTCLGIGDVAHSETATKTGGYLGYVLSLGAFYQCMLILLTKESSHIQLWEKPMDSLWGVELVDDIDSSMVVV